MLLLQLSALIFCLSVSLQQGPNYTGFIVLLTNRAVFICCSCGPAARRAERGTLTPTEGQTRPHLFLGAEKVQIIKTKQARDSTGTTDRKVMRRNGTADSPEKAGRPFVGEKKQQVL